MNLLEAVPFFLHVGTSQKPAFNSKSLVTNFKLSLLIKKKKKLENCITIFIDSTFFCVGLDPPNASDDKEDGELSDTLSEGSGSFTSEEGLILLELDEVDDDLMEQDNQPSTSGELHLFFFNNPYAVGCSNPFYRIYASLASSRDRYPTIPEVGSSKICHFICRVLLVNLSPPPPPQTKMFFRLSPNATKTIFIYGRR